ncbi:MAG: DUF4142 domain-containing protein, partial [Flavitalea sp.]
MTTNKRLVKKIPFVFAGLCLGILMLRPFSSVAQAMAPEKSASAAAASDVQLIANNIADNEDAIMLSQKAVERAADSRIKELAQEMVTDHTAMLYSLEQLATAGSGSSGQGGGNIQGMPQHVSEINDKLSKLRGSDFDTLWVSSLLNLQQLKYDELTRQKETVRNPQLK